MHSEILWDVNIQTNHMIEHRRPDIIVNDKNNKRVLLMDIAVPSDARVSMAEVKRYQNTISGTSCHWRNMSMVLTDV